MKRELVETITVGEYIARIFEREAAGMPSSYKEHNDILREQATRYRADTNPTMVRIWEDRP